MSPVLSGRRESADGLALADDLENALPKIVRQCPANPKARYADYLPASLQQRL